MDYGVLEVRTPDGNVRKYPIDAPTTVIGRVAPAFILIDHISVARRHALLRIGQETTIQDLGSATGTFLNGRRLEANESVTVPEGAAIRFGEAHATFSLPTPEPEPVPESKPAPEEAKKEIVASAAVSTPPSGVPKPAPEPTPDADEASFSVSLVSPSDAVATGAAVTATVAVQNRGSSMDEFTIRVPDLPEGWTRVTRPSVTLMPNVREEVTIVLQPPREAAATSGRHEFGVVVMSRESRQEVIAVGHVNIRPFEKLDAKITPKRGKGPFTVALENQGNAAYIYSLTTDADEDVLTVDLPPGEIQIEPEETKEVRVLVRRTRGSAFGRSSTHAFQIDVVPEATAQDRRLLPAQLDVKPPLRHWRWMLVGIVLLAAAGAAAFFFFGRGDDDSPPPLATATVAVVETSTPGATEAPATEVAGAPTLGPNEYAVVINSAPGNPDACLNVRESPSLSASDPDEICDGMVVFVVEDKPQQGDDFRWFRVRYTRTEAGVNPTRAVGEFEGWVAVGAKDGSEDWLEWVADPNE